MRFVDLFAGLGGFHIAAAQLGGRCVFACEIDSVLRKVYRSNFALEPASDIRLIDPSDVPQHDLLCAGFPCQPFSKAGGQMGWKDAARGNVFFKIAEILKARRPKYVILENVAHFVRHDSGNTYAKVKHALESLGYSTKCTTLSPHWFGIPQIRERMYLVGKRRGLNGFTWPTPETRHTQLNLREFLDANPPEAKPLSKQVIACLKTWQGFLSAIPRDAKLPTFPIWGMEFDATYPFAADSLYDIPLAELRRFRGSFGAPLNFRFREQILRNVPSYARRAQGTFPNWKQAFISQNREFLRRHRSVLRKWGEAIQEFPPSLQKLEWNCLDGERNIWEYVIQFRASGVRVKRPTTSPSLVAMTTTQVPIIAWERRYMTVREGARLQSMECLKHMPSETAAMKALGNAVNVSVVRLILERLLGSN